MLLLANICQLHAYVCVCVYIGRCCHRNNVSLICKRSVYVCVFACGVCVTENVKISICLL